MEPINYMLDVASPIQMAIKGYGLGRQEIEQNQIMAERAQMMDLRAAQEARAAAAAEEQRAAAAQTRAKAEAMQAQLVDLRERALNGTLTVDALNQFSLANAETFADFTTAFKQMEADKSRPQVQFAIETAIPALSGNPDRALAIIDERIAAAENAGELQEAEALRANRAVLEADPQAYGVSSLSMLVATGAIDNAQAETILKLSGQGEETTEAVRTLQQRAKLAGLVEGTPEYNQFMISGGKAPEGMAIRTTPEGGIEFIQGPGVGGATGPRAKDYLYTTDDQGLPVARPIAGTPAATEVQAQRGRLEAAIGVGENMLQTIESVVGRPAGGGQTGIPPAEALPGILGLIEGRLPAKTQAEADLLARVDQISGRAFLEAFETLKGAGQITEIEGTKATQALARLQRTQSPEAFQEALFEFADIVRRGIARSRNELTVLPEVAPAGDQGGQGAAPSGRIRYDADGNRMP